MRRTLFKSDDGQRLLMQHPAELTFTVGDKAKLTLTPVAVAVRAS